MSRGIMYHIGKMDSIGGYVEMDESDFYEHIDALAVDYVKTQAPEDAKASVQHLVSRLWDAEFKVKSSMMPEYEGFYSFNTGSKEELIDCKAKYFAKAFATLQEMVKNMSLKTFADDRYEEFTLRSLINNKAGDAVYYGECGEAIYSLDSFIRILEPDTGYFIAPETVYMH